MLSRRQKISLVRIIIGLIGLITMMIIDHNYPLTNFIANKSIAWILPFSIYLVIYLVVAYDVLLQAIVNIFHGQIFDEKFLMLVATIGAFLLSEYSEAVAVMLFFKVGDFFENYAVNKSRKSISSLMDIRPDFANLLIDGQEKIVDPEDIKVDDIILVKPGERIPLDGIVIEGVSTLDAKALTGEALPKDVMAQNEVISGCVNLTGTLKIKVIRAFYDSTVSKILDLVENASSQKSKSESFITKFARYYTPAVVICALLLAVIPGAITNEWSVWIYRALSFLVVSCPCALVISVPLSFFSGIGAASKQGILIKGSNYLEKLDKANIFVFDKTGTLTKGNFEVVAIEPLENSDEILRLAAIAEAMSNHPIALSISKAYAKEVEKDYELIDVAGKGIIATSASHTILCGNEKLMADYQIAYAPSKGIGTKIYVAYDNQYVGSILIADEIKPEAKSMISYLNSVGANTIMLTGDNEQTAAYVADTLGVKNYKASLLPQDKVEEVDKLIRCKGPSDVLCFIGDGINDAPVLMKSDIGIAMGGVGSDAAIEASDVVLMHDDLRGISKAKKISAKTLMIVKQNIIFALVIKGIVLILSTTSYANMWLAVIADVGVSVLAILNAMRVNSKYK